MPVRQYQLPSGKVRVSTPGGVKAKAATPANATRQANLLRAVEHGWHPTGNPARDRLKKGHSLDGPGFTLHDASNVEQGKWNKRPS